MVDGATPIPNLAKLWDALDPDVAGTLDRALSGEEITVEEGERLFKVTGLELMALVAVADTLRRRTVGDRVTYVRVRNVNFTNVCYTGCRFCEFGKRLDDPEAYTFSIEEVVEQARQAWAWGCTEICMQGGLHPKLAPTIYRDLIVAIKAAVPEIHIHAFSPFEIQYGSRRLGISPRAFLQSLQEAGLGSIPGTAAEILDDRVRHRLTENKLSSEAWVDIIKTAHWLGIPSTSTIMYGHIDGPTEWARHLDLLRRIQQETGGFTEFVPLGFVHEETRLFHEDGARPGPTGLEDIKMHAVARLMLNNSIPNIQVSWVKLGHNLAQLCLNAGANDFGGTLINERISSAAGVTAGTHTPVADFDRLILDLGRIPAERTTLYRILYEGARDEAAPSATTPIPLQTDPTGEDSTGCCAGS